MRSTLVLLLMIVGLAVSLRLPELADYPPGFFCDEADIANNAFALWKTGRDTYGERLPVFFQALGDYKNPVAIYSSIPFVAAMPSDERAVRRMAALYGVLAVLALFLLTSELFDETTGLWAALFLAVCPWHVHLSRIGMEFSPSIFWMTFALFAFLRGLRQIGFYAVGCASLILGLLSYYTPWLYTPPLLAGLVVIHRREVRKSWVGRRAFWVISALAVMTITALVLPSWRAGHFLGRWRSVRAALSISDTVQAYLNHFSLSFLFRTGDAGFPGQNVVRHSVVGIGELYWMMLPLLLAAPAAWYYWPARRRGLMTVGALLAVYPLGSIFTAVNPFATRSSIGVVAFCALAAVGARLAESLTKGWRPRVLQGVLALSLVLSLHQLHERTREYAIRGSSGDGWQAGARAAFRYFADRERSYQRLLLTHRFNAGEALRDFYLRGISCPKCGLFGNPLPLSAEGHDLLAVRFEDIEEARLRYPGMHFFEQARIFSGGGWPELLIGTFSRLPGLPDTATPEPAARVLASP